MPQLPFKVPPALAKTMEIGDESMGIIEVPVMGSVTVGEELTAIPAIRAMDPANGATTWQAYTTFALLLIQRINPQTTAADLDGVSTALIERLAALFLDERDRQTFEDDSEKKRVGKNTKNHSKPTSATAIESSQVDGQGDIPMKDSSK